MGGGADICQYCLMRLVEVEGWSCIELLNNYQDVPSELGMYHNLLLIFHYQVRLESASWCI